MPLQLFAGTVPFGQTIFFPCFFAWSAASPQQPLADFWKHKVSSAGGASVLRATIEFDVPVSFSAGVAGWPELDAGGGGASGPRTIGTYVTGGLRGGSAHAPIPSRSSGHAFIPLGYT